MFNRSPKKKYPRTILICPHCLGTDVVYESALITGYKYHCQGCDYVGALILEKDLDDAMNEAENEALEETRK